MVSGQYQYPLWGRPCISSLQELSTDSMSVGFVLSEMEILHAGFVLAYRLVTSRPLQCLLNYDWVVCRVPKGKLLQ